MFKNKKFNYRALIPGLLLVIASVGYTVIKWDNILDCPTCIGMFYLPVLGSMFVLGIILIVIGLAGIK